MESPKKQQTPRFSYYEFFGNNLCDVAASTRLVCLHCFREIPTFSSFNIKEMPSGSRMKNYRHKYSSEEYGNTVLCPHCNCDTVICNSRVPTWTQSDLQKWHKELFLEASPRQRNDSPRKKTFAYFSLNALTFLF